MKPGFSKIAGTNGKRVSNRFRFAHIGLRVATASNETKPEFRLWAERRPEVGIGHIGETTVRYRRDLGQLIDRLWTIVLAKEILAGRIEHCVFLQVVRPISNGNWITACPACFKRILIDRGIDMAKIVQDF